MYVTMRKTFAFDNLLFGCGKVLTNQTQLQLLNSCKFLLYMASFKMPSCVTLAVKSPCKIYMQYIYEANYICILILHKTWPSQLLPDKVPIHEYLNLHGLTK